MSLGGNEMEELQAEWLPCLSTEVVAGVKGNLLDTYAVALEGWRRGLTLRWHAKDSEKFSEMTTWFVDQPGQLFSLSSEEKTHYFFRSRGDKVTNEAVAIGKDKEWTKQILKQAGVPTPEGKQFQEDESDIVIRKYVSSLGYPVVLKPTDGSFGHGVVTNINNDDDLDYALNYVREELNIKNIIIEQYIPGEEYRIYVVKDQVVGAINRVPAHVIGDGVKTIDELVAQKNKDRELNPHLITRPLKLDNETERFISQSGYTKDSIPDDNERVYLSKKSNISAGGDPIDVYNKLSDENKRVAVNAINAVKGLNHGAVDLIIHSGNPNKGSGYVIELNPTAQIGSILYPVKGRSRDVPKAIIDYYFPETKKSSKLNSHVYFDLQEVLAPISNRAASVTEVAPMTQKNLIGKKLTIAGNVQSITFQQKIKDKAVEQSLMGKINIVENNKMEVIVAGEQVQIEAFKQFISNMEENTDIEEAHEEDWHRPIKLGFDIQGESKNLLIELDKLENNLIQSKNEQKKLDKQYQKMLRSNSWKITKPFRKVSGSMKKMVKRN